MLMCVHNAMNMYLARGHTIDYVFADSEFASIRDGILPTVLELAAAGEHVPEVERSVRILKDRIRTIVFGLPYEYYPRIMLKAVVHPVVSMLNSFPSQNGVSQEFSPRTIITGIPSISAKEFKLEFGEYVQVHSQETKTNNLSLRSTGAIALCPANLHGGWSFTSLHTGEKLIRYSWTPCNLTADINERVHDLSKDRKAFKSMYISTLFEWAPGHPIEHIGIEGANLANAEFDEFNENTENNAQENEEVNVHEEETNENAVNTDNENDSQRSENEDDQSEADENMNETEIEDVNEEQEINANERNNEEQENQPTFNEIFYSNVPEDEEMAKNNDAEEAVNDDKNKDHDESTITTTNIETGEERSAERDNMNNLENEEERSATEH